MWLVCILLASFMVSFVFCFESAPFFVGANAQRQRAHARNHARADLIVVFGGAQQGRGKPVQFRVNSKQKKIKTQVFNGRFKDQQEFQKSPCCAPLTSHEWRGTSWRLFVCFTFIQHKTVFFTHIKWRLIYCFLMIPQLAVLQSSRSLYGCIDHKPFKESVF